MRKALRALTVAALVLLWFALMPIRCARAEATVESLLLPHPKPYSIHFACAQSWQDIAFSPFVFETDRMIYVVQFVQCWST